MMRRPRPLSAAERALWDQIARGVTPLEPRKQVPPPAPAPVSAAKPTPPRPEPVKLPAFQLGERAEPARNSTSTRLPPRSVRMDARTHGKMRKGRLKPEARIDLHGMTLAQAHRALIGFVLSSRAAGHRLVLVITGKGRMRDDSQSTRGLLREQVPDWLTLPPLADHVLDVTTAHANHGGGGALYVYLRRR